jgi:curved DNA-binding protein CbpA
VTRQRAEEDLKRINRAYSILSNQQERKDYYSEWLKRQASSQGTSQDEAYFRSQWEAEARARAREEAEARAREESRARAAARTREKAARLNIRHVLLIICILSITMIGITITVILSIDSSQQKTWAISWYPYINGNAEFESSIGSSSFPSTFDYDWGDGTVFNDYSDKISFVARTEINVQSLSDQTVQFTIGADTFACLFIDGEQILSIAPISYYQTKTDSINLTPGNHDLTIYYMHVLQSEHPDKSAHVTFNCTPNVLQTF